MRAASQLSGRGPTDVDVALYLHVNQKSNYDDMMYEARYEAQTSKFVKFHFNIYFAKVQAFWILYDREFTQSIGTDRPEQIM